MRRANAQLQSDRRAEILAAAQRCFVRSGFHGASMQDICAEAAMRRLCTVLLAALLLAAAGCGPSEKERGINSGKDKPRTTTEKAE